MYDAYKQKEESKWKRMELVELTQKQD
jgi:hypothetical protein